MCNFVAVQKPKLWSIKNILTITMGLYLLTTSDNFSQQVTNAEPTEELYGAHGTYEQVLIASVNHFYPKTEVRSLKDIPITVFIGKIDNKTSVAPAAGLDVLGVWFNLKRPKGAVSHQDNKADLNSHTYRQFKKGTGTLLSVFGTGNAAYTVFPFKDSVGTSEVNTAKTGAYFSLGGGFLADFRWLTQGSQKNRVALGFLVRYGYFLADGEKAKRLWTFGPVFNISID
jgi:hypothetical protein